MIKRIIILFLIVATCFRIGWIINQNKEKYRTNYWSRYELLKSVYGESQYSMKEWKYWIPDETVYSYAGGAYIKGANPIIVEPTQPPLGKYLIGLSIFVTGNENIIVVVFFIFFLIGIYLLSYIMTGNIFISILVSFVASFEKLFINQLLITPLLDIFFITFIQYAIIMASYAMKKNKPSYLLLCYLFLGLSIMTKVWLIGAVFATVITIYVFVKKSKYFIYILIGGLIILATILLTYIRMLMDGYNVIEVLKVQKWLFWYQNGKLNHLFTIWPLIFLNRWYVWWGDLPVIQDLNWSISWPIFIGSGIVLSIKNLWSLFKNIEPAIQISTLSILAYAVFISFGQASARYLLPLLPLCYSITICTLFTIGKRLYFKGKHV